MSFGIHKFERNLEQSVKDADKVIILPHKYPDFDAIGSAIGLSVLMSSFNKDAYILVDDDEKVINNKVLEIINQSSKIYKFINLEEYLKIKSDNDVLIVTDTNKKDMIHISDYLDDFRDIFIVDHHRVDSNTIDTIDDNIFISELMPSASAIVTEMLMDYNIRFSSSVADYLYSGIVLDTNSFTKSVNSYTMRIITKLLEMGAEVDKVNNMFKRDNIQNLKIFKLASKVKIIKYPLGFAGVSYDDENYYTREDIAKAADDILNCRMLQTDLDDNVINNLNASFVMGLIDDNNYHVSARSNSSGVDVCKVMEYIGGGGSKHSAAALVPVDSLEKTLKKVYKKLESK